MVMSDKPFRLTDYQREILEALRDGAIMTIDEQNSARLGDRFVASATRYFLTQHRLIERIDKNRRVESKGNGFVLSAKGLALLESLPPQKRIKSPNDLGAKQAVPLVSFNKDLREGGYAVSWHGFLKIVNRMDSTVVVEHVATEVIPAQSGGGALAKPGAPEGYDLERTKILSDTTSEYLQWGRAKHNPKWRPWDGQPILYRVMSPEFWPRD